LQGRKDNRTGRRDVHQDLVVSIDRLVEPVHTVQDEAAHGERMRGRAHGKSLAIGSERGGVVAEREMAEAERVARFDDLSIERDDRTVMRDGVGDFHAAEIGPREQMPGFERARLGFDDLMQDAPGTRIVVLDHILEIVAEGHGGGARRKRRGGRRCGWERSSTWLTPIVERMDLNHAQLSRRLYALARKRSVKRAGSDEYDQKRLPPS
jgi:hypothetical protein